MTETEKPQHIALPAECQRTRPDHILYDPTAGRVRGWDDPDFYWLNEHILVQQMADGNLLAMWTSERLRRHVDPGNVPGRVRAGRRIPSGVAGAGDRSFGTDLCVLHLWQTWFSPLLWWVPVPRLG